MNHLRSIFWKLFIILSLYNVHCTYIQHRIFEYIYFAYSWTKSFHAWTFNIFRKAVKKFEFCRGYWFSHFNNVCLFYIDKENKYFYDTQIKNTLYSDFSRSVKYFITTPTDQPPLLDYKAAPLIHLWDGNAMKLQNIVKMEQILIFNNWLASKYVPET